MNLIKRYQRNNTITVSLVSLDGEEVQTIENVSLEGSKGLLVVSIDEGSTYQEAEMVRRALETVLKSSNPVVSLIVPSNIKIDYIKF